MYVNIDAKNAFRKTSQGKSSFCVCREPQVRATTKWREQQKGIEITGRFSDISGTGERGGSPRTINRHFEVWLGEEDLRIIIIEALKSGLVCFPGEKQILEAKRLLEMTLGATSNDASTNA